MMRPCVECGELSDLARCPTHRLPTAPKRSGKERGYDARWRRLSERARRLQPWCSDCGTDSDLTTDHSPAAWQRRERGLAIRLVDVDVVCRSCNARRGRARPEAQGADPGAAVFTPPAVRRNFSRGSAALPGNGPSAALEGTSRASGGGSV